MISPTDADAQNYEGAGMIFVTRNYDFLLIQDTESKKWGMCKGHRDHDFDTDYLHTAKREAFEELGLMHDRDYDIVSSPFILEGSPRIYIFYYAMLKVSLDQLILQKDEIMSAKLVKYNDMPKCVNNKKHYNIYIRLLVYKTMGVSMYKEEKTSTYVPKYRMTENCVKEEEPLEDEEIDPPIAVVSTTPIQERDRADSVSAAYLIADPYDMYEDEEIIEPSSSAIDESEQARFIPILDLSLLSLRSFSQPAYSPSPVRASPFIPIRCSPRPMSRASSRQETPLVR